MRPLGVRDGRALGPVLCLVLVLGCGDSGTNPGGRDSTPDAVEVAPSTATLVSVGDTLPLTATVTDAAGRTLSTGVTWSSGAPDVASVDASGRVVALANGTASITATAGGVSGRADITVRQAVAASEVSGGEQAADVQSPLDSAVAVTLLDARGNGIPGAPVAVEVQSGGGSVDPSVGTTDGSGSLSFSWSLGDVAGLQEVRVTGGFDAEASMTVGATAYPLTAAEVVTFDGDGQTELVGLPLPAPVRVQVLDPLGNGVPDSPVIFGVTGDAVVEDTVYTDLDGVAATPLTLGSSLGVYTVTARAFIYTDTLGTTQDLTGSPRTLTAEAVSYLVNAPGTLATGDTVSVTGSGFHPVPDSNTVTLGGAALQILEGTQSSLSFVVPDFGCVPEQVRPLVVSRTGSGGEVPATVVPLGALDMAVGERVLLDDPGSFCLPLPGGSNSQYIVGLTATAWFDASSTFRITGIDSAAAAAGAGAPAPPRAGAESDGEALTVRGGREAHRESLLRSSDPELALRAREEDLVEAHGASSLASPPVARAVAIGDLLDLRIPNTATDACSDYSAEAFEVAYGAPGLVYALPPAFVDTYESDGQWGAFINALDNLHGQYWSTAQTQLEFVLGTTADWDADPQVIMVLTPSVSTLGLPGFDAYSSVVDRLPRSACAASDEARIIYVRIPEVADMTNVPAAIEAAFPDIAHHFTHVFQWDRRLEQGADLLPAWLAEGQAEAMVERIGLWVTGGWGIQNKTTDVLSVAPDLIDWIAARFDRLSLYQGEDPDVNLAILPGAPEGCSLYGFQGVCGAASFPGATWTFTRYVVDRFGPSFPSGEEDIMAAIIDFEPGVDEAAQLSELLGVPTADVVADWAAMLYVDDRLLYPTAAEQQFLSWRLPSWLAASRGTVRYAPPQYGFTAWERTGSVIGGGTAYTLVTTTTAHPALAVEVKNDAGGDISALLKPRLWVVRMR